MIECMRTTLTLEDDVAASIQRLRRARKISLKQLVNEALRQGLAQMERPDARQERYRTPAVDLGGCRIGDLDDVAEVLALAEGDDHR